MSERDTHFQGYAKLVEQEIYDMLLNTRDVADVRETIRQIMAHRGYDLVMYSQQFMPGIENIPDVTSWDDIEEEHKS